MTKDTFKIDLQTPPAPANKVHVVGASIDCCDTRVKFYVDGHVIARLVPAEASPNLSLVIYTNDMFNDSKILLKYYRPFAHTPVPEMVG